jgi:hypothetical protein
MVGMSGFQFTDDEESDDGDADALLEDMRKLTAQLASAVEEIDSRELSANVEAQAMHDRLSQKAKSIMSSVVAGESEEDVSPDASYGPPMPNETEVEPHVSTNSSGAELDGAQAANGLASARNVGAAEPGRADSGVGHVVSDISRLASKPLLDPGRADSGVGHVVRDISRLASRPLLPDIQGPPHGVRPRKVGGLASTSQLGGAARPGRGVGSRFQAR